MHLVLVFGKRLHLIVITKKRFFVKFPQQFIYWAYESQYGSQNQTINLGQATKKYMQFSLQVVLDTSNMLSIESCSQAM